MLNTVILITGVQETIVKCVNKLTGKAVPNKNCLEAPSIPSKRTVCNDVNCPQRLDNFSNIHAFIVYNFQVDNSSIFLNYN